MLSFEEAIEKYEKYLRSQETPNNTERTSLYAIRRFQRWLNCEHIEEINPDSFMDYKTYLKDSGSGGSSINTYFSQLKSFFTTLHERKYTGSNLSKYCEGYIQRRVKDIKGVRQEKYHDEVKKFITKEDKNKMLKFALKTRHGKRDRLMFLTAMACGLRISEVVALKPKHFKDTDFATKLTIEKSKRNKTRTFDVLDQEFLREIKEYISENQIKDDEFIFINRYGKPITVNRFQEIFKEVLTLAKIPVGRANGGYTTHDLRGRFITILLDSGFTAQEVAEIVGHESVDQTLSYKRKNDGEEKTKRQMALYKKALAM